MLGVEESTRTRSDDGAQAGSIITDSDDGVGLCALGELLVVGVNSNAPISPSEAIYVDRILMLIREVGPALERRCVGALADELVVSDFRTHLWYKWQGTDRKAICVYEQPCIKEKNMRLASAPRDMCANWKRRTSKIRGRVANDEVRSATNTGASI